MLLLDMKCDSSVILGLMPLALNCRMLSSEEDLGVVMGVCGVGWVGGLFGFCEGRGVLVLGDGVGGVLVLAVVTGVEVVCVARGGVV